ncbi:MAG: SpoIIE family protein phosphatase [Gemmatimonadota bacterium]
MSLLSVCPHVRLAGTFYQLFKLPQDRIGVMLGDVTSHGFGAALIMALSMGTAGIYAREKLAPGDRLKAVHHELIQKLESTETFMTLFYGVIGPTSPSLRTTEEALLAAVHANRDASAREIVDALFEARERQGGTAPDDQTALVLRG